MKPWEKFLDKYKAFGQKPTREAHAALFAPDATIFHPGMTDPMPAASYVDFIQTALRQLPDFHLIPVHWAVNGDTVFVEARNTAELNGRTIMWPATYVVTLRGEMVARARAYYDRTEVIMHFEPSLSADRPNAHATLLENEAPHGSSAADSDAYAREVYEKIVVPYAENGKDPDPEKFQRFYAPDARMINPGFERPLRRDELPGYYAGLKSQIHNLQLRPGRWAAAPGLLFIEWTVTGELSGRPLVLPNADRFKLREMLATEGVAYFDDLTIRAFVDPSLARFVNVSFGNVSVGAA